MSKIKKYTEMIKRSVEDARSVALQLESKADGKNIHDIKNIVGVFKSVNELAVGLLADTINCREKAYDSLDCARTEMLDIRKVVKNIFSPESEGGVDCTESEFKLIRKEILEVIKPLLCILENIDPRKEKEKIIDKVDWHLDKLREYIRGKYCRTISDKIISFVKTEGKI